MAKTLSRVPTPTGEILAEDMEFTTEREDWNVYKLEDGTVLRVKLVALKISRGLMDDKKSIRYNPDGEPFYNVRWNTMIASQVPWELMQEKQGGR